MSFIIQTESFPAPIANQEVTLGNADGLFVGGLARCCVMIGYRSRAVAIRELGTWRARMLEALVEGCIDADITMSDFFGKLEPSEKAAVTFWLAQAFTQYAVERVLSIGFLMHVYQPHGISIRHERGHITNLKAGATPPNLRARPDFVGFDGARWNVFECKGRSGTVPQLVRAKSLGQASRVRYVNGHPPAYKVACLMSFRGPHIRGTLVDPDDSTPTLDIRIDVRRALQFYYLPFVRLFRDPSTDKTGDSFAVQLDGSTALHLDRRVFEVLVPIYDTDKVLNDEAVTESLQKVTQLGREFSERRSETYQAGPDGVALTMTPQRVDELRRRTTPTG